MYISIRVHIYIYIYIHVCVYTIVYIRLSIQHVFRKTELLTREWNDAVIQYCV